MRIGQTEFDTDNQTYVMGILNVTPDSFSDGGSFAGMDSLLRRVEAMEAEGCDILDIGGESTRPGFTPVSAQEEIERVAPVVAAVKERFALPVSVDTSKSEVAEVVLKEGTDLINDIQGFRGDEKMAKVVKDYDAACVLMHNREETLITTKNGQEVGLERMDQLVSERKDRLVSRKDTVFVQKEKRGVSEIIMDTYLQELEESVQIAKEAGIADERIILDPGIGFGKTHGQNLLVMRNLEKYHVLGYPLLLGASRKSMIGNVLKLPVEEREEGTLVTTVLAAQCGYSFVRVHDVKANKRALQMLQAIRGAV